MIKREDLAGKNQQEVQAMLENNIQLFMVEVGELASEGDVIAKEEELMQVMNQNEVYMRSIIYPVADEVTYDNTHYKKQAVCNIIADFIATQEVEWSYTLGLFELCKIWKSAPETIQYHAYDSTLRILGGMKFKGVESWRKILTVNEFLSSCHEEYMRDTAYMLYLSNLHNVVIDALKKFNPGPEEEAQAVEMPVEA